MAELLRANSMAEVERFIRELPPEQYIAVISDRSYTYVEDSPALIRSWETSVYEGAAKDFKQ